ncbi:uncharacterized protein LOC113549855 [Rhopalosiphum maidis]|uniref:uncharacterized protein LOC113549855 n=1 Tax=Rhopalosiphum maidis TaxID=43146 RepID=UPI000F0094EA|nr:uncharacterized protein LOC113549855 [Rhopalosiphum maidis]
MDQLVYIVCLFMTIFQSIGFSINIKRYDMCKPFNKKTIYTAIGSRGIIFAKNDVYNRSTLNESFYKQCSLRIISCPSCMINLRFKDVNLPCTNNNANETDFVCNSICIFEPPYSARSLKCVNSTVKNSTFHYKSLTSQVNLNFINRHPYHNHAFSAEYLITRNIQLAEIKPEFNSANILFGGYISTPFFPMSYPDDLTFEQVINCKMYEECFIHLIFVDFQISEESIVEFYDSNRKRLGVIGGITFRPPVIISSGPVLYIKFFANAGSSIGYKAQYSYVRGDVKSSILKPNTNCGGFVENKGGAITMMQMVEEFEPNVLFDCIWLFRISHKHNFKSQNLYMKVITLKDLVESNLVIREGRVSNGRLLQWFNGSHCTELDVAIEIGYYVRLTGTFNSSSRLEIAYSVFAQSRPCSEANEFACMNGRCIPNKLECDGFDHCGDNSDESSQCFEAHDTQSDYMDKSWYAYKSNYYFPNNTLYSKRYHILLGCFIGFIIFFIIVLMVVYRIATCYHIQTDFQNRLISISQLLLEGIQLDDNSLTSEIGRINSNYLIDEPPAYEQPPEYEAPPNYEEAIKMYKNSMKYKHDNIKTNLIDEELNDNSQLLHVNKNQTSSNVHLIENNNLYPHCLCCSQGSYHILALDINNMNRCCLNKMYSLRKLTINNQY